MFTTRELANLVEMAGVMPMANGWQVVIRADWTDESPQRPHGLTYALILQNPVGVRQLGFDNSHAFDGAGPDEPWDHEHPAGRVGQRRRYTFRSAGATLDDFLDRVESFSATRSLNLTFL